MLFFVCFTENNTSPTSRTENVWLFNYGESGTSATIHLVSKSHLQHFKGCLQSSPLSPQVINV